ncbi:MAG: methylated-DNA--[protein]-cysteine S-methyltransferase [Actinomycetales bacterium]
MSTTRHTQIETTMGAVTLLADGGNLIGLYFDGHRGRPHPAALGAFVRAEADPVLTRATIQLKEYLSGTRRGFDLPLAAVGDEFCQRVWGLLGQIPYGRTTTYGALAQAMGERSWAQRVGQAVGRNPLCVVIPCHRVIGADGALTGYAGGLSRKHWLLALEEPAGSRLF